MIIIKWPSCFRYGYPVLVIVVFARDGRVDRERVRVAREQEKH